MFDHFIDMIRTRNTRLAVLVAKEEFYRPLWTNFVGVPANGSNNGGGNVGNSDRGAGRGGGGGGAGASLTHPDNSEQINQQIRKLQEQNQRTTQAMERMRTDHARQLKSQPTSYPGASSNGLGDNRGGNNGGTAAGAKMVQAVWWRQWEWQ